MNPSGLEVAMANGPFKGTYTTSPHRATVRTVRDPSPLDHIITKYESFLDRNFYGYSGRHIDWTAYDELTEVTNQLSQQDWNLFIQMTASFEHHTRYQSNTGYFMTKLLANSCLAGLRDFTFDFKGIKPFHSLGKHFPFRCMGQKDENSDELWKNVKGDLKQSPISLTIDGPVGGGAFDQAGYVHLVLGEAGSRLLCDAQMFTATVRKAGAYSFLGIQNAEVTIHDAEEPATLFGFFIEGWEQYYPYNIKVKTPNPALIEPFQRNISKVKNGALYFIDPQGNDERVV